MTLAVRRIIEMSKEVECIASESICAKFASPICKIRMRPFSMDVFDSCWEGTVKDIKKALTGDFSGLKEEELEIFESLADFYYDGIFKGHLYAEKLGKYWE